MTRGRRRDAKRKTPESSEEMEYKVPRRPRKKDPEIYVEMGKVKLD